MGSVYNMSVTTSGGYLSVTGSGFYRNITPTQYFSGTATVTAEWDYTLYYGDSMHHQRVSVSISCYDNKVSIIPTTLTLSPGQTYRLGYRHAYDNQYVGNANAYFSGGSSCFTVTSDGLVTAKSPGTGYVNVYSKVSSESPYCYISVKDIEATGATTGNYTLLADQTIDLNVAVTPSNATVKSKQWYVKTGNDIVSISGSRLTGLKPGQATIYCMVNGSVKSNEASVTVSEPKLTKSSTSPIDGDTEVSAFVNPSVTYSHDISIGSDFDMVTLKEGGIDVEGKAEITGKTLKFVPAHPLRPQTNYTLSVPKTAIVNKWGGSAQSDEILTFKTGAYEKIILKISPAPDSYLTSSDLITISAVPDDATIYYSTDGSAPTKSSDIYREPIKHSDDVLIKAFAEREGYENSDVVSAQYYKSQNEVLSYYPNDNNPLFNYADVTPHINLSGEIVASNNFRRISLTSEEEGNVLGTPYITYNMIIFVPDEPLKDCTKYTMTIPNDAVKSINGEVFKGFTWSFTTIVHNDKISLRGDETVFVLQQNGVLNQRGMEYLTMDSANGSFTFKDNDAMVKVSSKIDDIAGGYTHNFVCGESSIEGQGFALCGETANKSNILSIPSPKLIKTGFQTSAIIDADNSLWMVGRNDFYQLCDNTGTTSKEFIKVLGNVKDVALGNGFTLYVDGNGVMWAVGRNHRGQLGDGTTIDRKSPVMVMENVEKVYASSDGFFSACLSSDGKLFTWGDNSSSQLGRNGVSYSVVPEEVMDGVNDVALGSQHALALTDDYQLYAWGSNVFGQISRSGSVIPTPTLFEQNVKMIDAGPSTSLILFNSDKVTGWGKKSHSNFGAGSGKAQDFVISDGNPYAPMDGVTLSPSHFEVLPNEEFALAAHPYPLIADYETLVWETSDPSVAEVSAKGEVTTYKEGEVEITVRLIDRFGNVREATSLIICTDNPVNDSPTAAVEKPSYENTSWTVLTRDSEIIIRDAAPGSEFMLYNLAGIVLDTKICGEGELIFNVLEPDLYILQSGSRTVKVLCKF